MVRTFAHFAIEGIPTPESVLPRNCNALRWYTFPMRWIISLP